METSETNSQRIPNGAAWAAILAASVGCAALGVLVDLAEASKSVSKLLNFYNPAGDLTGKTTVTVIIWLITWVILHARWKNRNIRSAKTIMAIMLLLILIALIGVFPPFFSLFEAK